MNVRMSAIILLSLSWAVTAVSADSVTVTLANENFSSLEIETQIEGSGSTSRDTLRKQGELRVTCPKAGAVLYRSREPSNDFEDSWTRVSCGFDFRYRIVSGGRIRNSGSGTTESGGSGSNCGVLASNGASASNETLTDGAIGSQAPGQNASNTIGTFWVELPQAETVHRVVVHSHGNGVRGDIEVVGYGPDGNLRTLGTKSGNSADPIAIDVGKEPNIKKVEVTIRQRTKDWIALTELQVFVCR